VLSVYFGAVHTDNNADYDLYFYLLNAFYSVNNPPLRPVFISDKAADLFISFTSATCKALQAPQRSCRADCRDGRHRHMRTEQGSQHLRA